ncbi:MAG: nuclear transport factor 2 family protein [Gammaproteobacteria bacterium]|nr:nuclear transport factor 2 family protein [Gammaproteobacteria bacterium]
MSSLGEGRIVVGTARGERGDVIDLVRRWFDATAARDLGTAASLMSSTVRITISGGHRFNSLTDFMAFGAALYHEVRKQCDSFEACEAAGGFAVYVRGEMTGSWLDGMAFSRVRWCDRFLVQGGHIVDLETWSDLAETRLQL